MAISVTKQLVKELCDAGVRPIYGLVGDSLNPIVDAVRPTEGIDWVHIHNQQAAAFAASAEVRLTGREPPLGPLRYCSGGVPLRYCLHL